VNNIGFQEQIMTTLRAPRKFGLAETANPLVFQGEAIPPPEPLPWYHELSVCGVHGTLINFTH